VPPELGTQMSPNADAAGNRRGPTSVVLITRFVAGSIRERVSGLYALGEHRIRTRGGPALLFGYAATSEPGLRPGVRELAAAVRALSA
jgi:hypothetical protein